MKETLKAMRRRKLESLRGEFPWDEIFKGTALDIGPGDCPLPLPDVVAFDKEQGDANHIAQYFPKDHFDVVHASQCLEHLFDPFDALRQWIEITRPGGHIVFTVPDLIYERFTYPSKHNPDHKVSFSMLYEKSAFPCHCHLPSFLEQFKNSVDIILCRYVERNFDWTLPASIDQTWEESAGCEIWNEVVLRKK